MTGGTKMKRIWCLGAALILAAGISELAVAQTTTQTSPSLGDIARTARKDKKDSSARQYDNDNLPQTDKLSIVGTASEDPAPNASSASADADGNVPATKVDDPAKKEIKKIEPGQSPEERAKIYDDWKKKIEIKKSHVDMLSRELDVLQREFRLRQTAYYADAGLRLRNASSWDKDDAKYKQEIDDKQAAVEKAKGELEDLQEQARKAGTPSSVRE
jgi:hypothetical protein